LATSHAAGIEYHRIPGFAHEMFRCTTWRANLSVPACASRWREAQTAKGERAEQLFLCHQCQVGAAHAGERILHRSAEFGRPICPRCRKGTFRRLIGQRTCINCYNRQVEWILGKNAKGTPPTRAIKRLAVRGIGIILNVGEPTERRVRFSDVAVDFEELRLAVLRVHEGRIEFCLPHPADPEWRPDGLGEAPDPQRLPASAYPIRWQRPNPMAPMKLAALASTSLSSAIRLVWLLRPAAPWLSAVSPLPL
jgi:hypothetical protein